MVRPTQQSSTKRKRKSNDLIWARDGDHKNAQEHPAYILENCNEEVTSKNDNDDDEVWVEWSSNGTVACIPKSRISTAGLSSRRRRTTNNDTKQPAVNDVQQTISNEQKNAPSKKQSNDSQSKSINNSTAATLKKVEDSKLDDKRIPHQILVEGCGIPEMNGTYHLDCGVERVYIKSGEWKGEVEDFLVYRSLDSHDKHTHWYIGIYRGGYIPSARFYKAANNTEQPTVNGWTKVDHGVDPAPTLKYVYKTTDNNIASSVSDSTKVKKEDSTKVKEEMYGGETDDEDKKIAAVPTPVVSSQLKKKEYDEDTDEDTPDTVQSTQVKVKEEAGEDTDEDAVPDSVHSAQVKQEHDEESTDDEGIAPDPILSTRVKTEEEETDDEGTPASAKEKPTRVLQKRWICDVCKVKWFLDFSEAVEHEKTCQYVGPSPSLSRSSDTNESGDDGEDRKIAASQAADEEKDTKNDESISAWDSDNEEYDETAKVYLWCDAVDRILLVPYNYYLFFKKLELCRTWGDIRKLCGKDHYYHFEDMYKEKRIYEYNSDFDEDSCNKKFIEDEMTDDKSVCIDDFDHSWRDLPYGMFPPVIEQVMWDGAASQKRHDWMYDYGENGENSLCGERWLQFNSEDKEKIFKKIEELGCTVKYHPQLGKEFKTIHNM